MINEVLSLRHKMQEQLDQEYKERKEQERVSRKMKVRQMVSRGDSLSNERKKGMKG
jgi:hypothetical protein